ncbi:IS3 family transposase [Weissella paramesenteroides]|uniref:IS3 family transposase n=1 Tax=Weissella paramesenteroides TaxID=1249 RepID=UPI00388D1C04
MPTHYDKEFKQNIIHLYKHGEAAAQLAREYGIGYSTVHKWVQAQTQNKSGKTPDESKAMEKRLNELHIRHSYSRKVYPYDNAPMESFHASLKKECVYPIPVFEKYEAAASALFEYVHSFYNRIRIYSSLSYQPPLAG